MGTQQHKPYPMNVRSFENMTWLDQGVRIFFASIFVAQEIIAPVAWSNFYIFFGLYLATTGMVKWDPLYFYLSIVREIMVSGIFYYLLSKLVLFSGKFFFVMKVLFMVLSSPFQKLLLKTRPIGT
ncbi:MAG: hypothetical protein OEX00_00440 [Gammaproteobacteria bacterium]|nr:hypothetical protein [Gammaproteobacteria bacterium]